ncbi:MAG: cupin domain-containing protein [Treponemataceae bacterium]
MITNRKQMKVQTNEKLRGGTGTVTMVHFADQSTMKHHRLLAECTIPPGASIGEHKHDNEIEYYIILEGKGIVVDNGVDVPVGPGDVVATGDGASHSIRNEGKVPLKFHAVIVTY